MLQWLTRIEPIYVRDCEYSAISRIIDCFQYIIELAVAVSKEYKYTLVVRLVKINNDC